MLEIQIFFIEVFIINLKAKKKHEKIFHKSKLYINEILIQK